jgi:signal transduction histidine kinase/ActR/RegA family two-component response regulator
VKVVAWLENLPIKRKLTLIMLFACTIVLLLAGGVLAGYEFFDFRRMMARDLTVLADALAKSSQAALAFQDENAARGNLMALGAEPYVSAACLYTTTGQVFADYERSGVSAHFPSQPPEDGHRFEHGHMVLSRPVMLDRKRIGTIYLEADLSGLYDRLRLYGIIVGFVLIGSVLVAFVLSPWMQRPISRPILGLAETARIVAEQKDYTVRAMSQGQNEMAVLTDAFNQVLTGIQEREKALRTANESLRGEIAERKGAEARAQSQLARLELLNQITRAIGERQNIEGVFHVVLKNVEEHLPVDFTCICRFDQARVLSVAAIGVHSRALAAKMGISGEIPSDENGLSQCLMGRLVYEPDTSSVSFPFPQRLASAGLLSLVAAPLLVESQVFGVLLAARRTAQAFSSAECEFLKQLSGHVALAAHQAQLYDALQRAYDDLRQTQQTVLQQERLRALGQMASGIAHDINNAMSPAALYTESILENEPNLSERTRGYLQTIQHAIEDVAATVARMREFYRQRETQLTLAPININRLVHQVIDLSRARWSDMPQQRGLMVKLDTELGPDLPSIMGVESEIREALLNLIFNAVDAMPDGGTLTLRTKLAGSESSGPDAPPRLSVEVSDTGVGMDEDTRRRCLEPFFTTKGERGTGLGLAMVYGAVQRHSAHIEIDSAAGKGTTMRLIFNISKALPDQSTGSEPALKPSRLRLLVVDDDPVLLKSLRDILEGDGHLVTIANGGEAGIDAFRASLAGKEQFSVVITDLGMPYVDGRKVAAAVKEASPATPVILLTGWGQRLVTEGDIPPGVNRVLSKPPKLKDLREALARCMLGKGSVEPT